MMDPLILCKNMKLLKKHTDILKELIKGKGYFRTPTVPYKHTDKKEILDLLVQLYLKGLLTFKDNMMCH